MSIPFCALIFHPKEFFPLLDLKQIKLQTARIALVKTANKINPKINPESFTSNQNCNLPFNNDCLYIICRWFIYIIIYGTILLLNVPFPVFLVVSMTEIYECQADALC